MKSYSRIEAPMISVLSTETREITSEDDLMQIKASVKRISALLGFSLVNQTKIITAAAELSRNTLIYGLGGDFKICVLDDSRRKGLQMIFSDSGPGIEDIEQAMKDGFTSGKGMGLGLGGSKRLMDEFDIKSALGVGTTVSVTKWV